MSEKKYYCFCSSNCKYETMTKEQILAAIAQAATTGLVYDPDAAVVSKVRESNAGGSVTFWVGTNAQYNALERVEPNCMYIITDDTYREDMEAAVQQALADAEEAKTAAAAAANGSLSKNGGAIVGDLFILGHFTTLGNIVLQQDVNYGTTLPAAGTKGRLFFLKVNGEYKVRIDNGTSWE